MLQAIAFALSVLYYIYFLCNNSKHKFVLLLFHPVRHWRCTQKAEPVKVTAIWIKCHEEHWTGPIQKQFKIDQPWDKIQINILQKLHLYRYIHVSLYKESTVISNAADHSKSTILLNWPQCNIQIFYWLWLILRNIVQVLLVEITTRHTVTVNSPIY